MENPVGLDIGNDSLPSSDDSVSLRDIAESAIQSALKGNRNRITFNTVSLKGREAELAEVCADLQKQYPGLQEIVPSRVDGTATAYLNEKPGPVKKFLLRFVTADV